MMKLRNHLVLIAFISLLFCSCNKNDDDEPKVDNSAKYALVTTVKGGTFNYGFYLQSIKTLSDKKEYNNKKATEIIAEGIAGIYEFNGNFYANKFGAPQEITKWVYDKKEGFTKEGRLSVSELGYQGNICFKDKNTAFVGGPSSSKILIFNPESMEKTGQIDFSSFSRLGEVTNFPSEGKKINAQVPTEMIISGNHLFIGFFFLNSLTPDIPASPTADMLVIDLNKVDIHSSDNSGAVVKWISSDKGNSVGSWNSGQGAKFMIKDSKNDIYMLCHNYWGGLNVGKPACILRIKKGETDFDPDYYFDLETASRGLNNPVVNFEYIGNGNFFATSNDKSKVNPDNPYSYYTDPIAQWYKFNLYDKTAQKVNDEYTIGAMASNIYFEKGKAYIPYVNKTASYIKEIDINTLKSKKMFTTAGIPRILKLK